MTYNRTGQNPYAKASVPTERATAGAYAKTAVSTTTSQKELIVMAYDGIIRFLRQGREHALNKEYEQKHINLTKARAIIEELTSTLNMEKGGQIAQNLWNLYIYSMEKITSANMTNNVQHIDDILPAIEELREGWAKMEIPKDDAEIQALNRRAAYSPSSHLSFTG